MVNQPLQFEIRWNKINRRKPLVTAHIAAFIQDHFKDAGIIGKDNDPQKIAVLQSTTSDVAVIKLPEISDIQFASLDNTRDGQKGASVFFAVASLHGALRKKGYQLKQQHDGFMKIGMNDRPALEA